MSHPLNRRAFVGSLAAGAVWATNHCTFANTVEKYQPIGLGFSLYGLPKMPLEEALTLCSKTGYNSVELALMPGLSGDPLALDTARRVRVREQLVDERLVLAGVMENLPVTADAGKHAEQLERLKRASELSHQLSPQSPAPLETIVGGKPGEWETFKTLLVDRLGSWAKVAEAEKLIVCVKPHAAGAMNRPEDAVWLMQQLNTPWIRLVYDFSHYEHRGYDISETVKSLIEYCPFVHVKDRAADTSRLQFLLPGDGKLDYTPLLRSLSARYAGEIVVEVSAQLHGKPDYDGRAAVEKCYQFLARACETAGVPRRKR